MFKPIQIAAIVCFLFVCSEGASHGKRSHHHGKRDDAIAPVECTKPNEVHVNCVPQSCEPTCENKGFAVCTLNCVLEGSCQCEAGYLRNTATGECVLAETCPSNTNTTAQCTKPHEVHVNCTPQRCEPTCDNQGIVVCPAICDLQGSCQCEKGYLRNTATGECVPAGKCSNKRCGDHETYVRCVPKYCEATCQNGGVYQCAAIDFFCDENSRGSCQCEYGYIRNTETEQCIPEGTCPGNCTKANEVFDSCTPKSCEKTCQNGGNVKCPKICDPNGSCKCKEEYIRDEATGECIPEGTCPNKKRKH